MIKNLPKNPKSRRDSYKKKKELLNKYKRAKFFNVAILEKVFNRN